VLHITNGDCAVAILSRAVSGTFLPWRDVLHEGPVRAGLPLEALSAERARFIEEAGWGSDVLRVFQERDRAFRHAGTHDEIVLWFEHDLYDQLQLIQVLDGLAELRGPPLSLVCEAEYLGEMTPQRAAELFALRSPVLRKHLQDAQAAWRAFRSPDPRAIESVTAPSLPFLGAALRRHLEEFPWTTDGLSRLERSIIGALPSRLGPLFSRVEEDPKFLGDVVLEWHLERLEAEGLVRRDGEAWAATGGTRKRRSRWLGGHEVRDEALRWDPAACRLV
jgi:hypothetical protein